MPFYGLLGTCLKTHQTCVEMQFLDGFQDFVVVFLCNKI